MEIKTQNGIVKLPGIKSRVGLTSNIKDIDGNPVSYTVVGEIVFPAPSNPRKAFAIHLLKYNSGEEEIRIGYYMISQKEGRMKGKWMWGQYSPIMTKEEMKRIYLEAINRGWI
ncbi:MAG: hypothetical protein V1681_03430 [Candidatus Neomarinimicrobiota bacterium]